MCIIGTTHGITGTIRHCASCAVVAFARTQRLHRARSQLGHDGDGAPLSGSGRLRQGTVNQPPWTTSILSTTNGEGSNFDMAPARSAPDLPKT